MSRFKSGHNESTQREMVFEARCYAEFFLIEPIGMQIMLYLFVACVHLRFFRESSLPATEVTVWTLMGIVHGTEQNADLKDFAPPILPGCQRVSQEPCMGLVLYKVR